MTEEAKTPEEPRTPAKKPRRLAFKLAALLGAIVFAFAVAEVAARIRFPKEPGQLQAGGTDDIKKGIRLPPSVTADYGPTIKVNALGFRDDEDFPEQKPAGERRVLFVGDSFLYAAKNALAETLPGRCEARLQASLGPALRTIDLSCPGWGTFHHREAFRVCGAPTQPDVVVLCFFVGNDVQETLQADRPDDADSHAVVVLSRSGEFALENRATRLHMRVLRCSKLFRLFQASAFYQRMTRGKARGARESLAEDAYWKIERFRMEQWRRGVSAKPLMAEAWTLVEKNLRALVAEVRAAGAKPAVLIIPDEVQVDSVKRAEVLRRFQLDEKDFDLGEPQRRVAALAAAESVPCVDVLPAFLEKGSQGGLYYDLDTHWNAKGHDLASELLAPALEKLLR